MLDTDASLFTVGGVLNQLQDDREVVIAYASRSLRLSQRWRRFVSGSSRALFHYGLQLISQDFPRNCGVGDYKSVIYTSIRTDHNRRRRAPPSGASQLVVPNSEHQDMIRRFHDSLFAGHLGVSRTVFRLQSRVYWPGLRQDVRTYLVSCTVCLARKSSCPWRSPMGHVAVGHRWIEWR